MLGLVSPAQHTCSKKDFLSKLAGLDPQKHASGRADLMGDSNDSLLLSFDRSIWRFVSASRIQSYRQDLNASSMLSCFKTRKSCVFCTMIWFDKHGAKLFEDYYWACSNMYCAIYSNLASYSPIFCHRWPAQARTRALPSPPLHRYDLCNLLLCCSCSVCSCFGTPKLPEAFPD